MTDEQLTLNSAAHDYFQALPGLKYPQALVDLFPRIANKLFSLKDDKPALHDYFEALERDQRGGRHGFQFGVLMNIQDLREVMLGDANGFVLDDNTKWVS